MRLRFLNRNEVHYDQKLLLRNMIENKLQLMFGNGIRIKLLSLFYLHDSDDSQFLDALKEGS
jgi:hypothetical protein